MGITKKLAIKTVAKKEMMDLYAESLNKLSGAVHSYQDSKLIRVLKDIYKTNYRIEPEEPPEKMEKLYYWVFANVYCRLTLELSYDPSFGTQEDYSLIFKSVTKNMYLFDNFGDALKLQKSMKDKAAIKPTSNQVESAPQIYIRAEERTFKEPHEITNHKKPETAMYCTQCNIVVDYSAVCPRCKTDRFLE